MKLEDALRAVNQTAANLRVLQKLWDEIETAIGSALELSHDYRDKRTVTLKSIEFRETLAAMPKIRGQSIEDKLPDYEAMFQAIIDCKDVGEFVIEHQVRDEALSQGMELAKYERLLNQERRVLTSLQIKRQVELTTSIVENLKAQADAMEAMSKLPDDAVQPLSDAVKELGALLGSGFAWPKQRADLMRHLRFHQTHDIHDIYNHDWPPILKGIEMSLSDGPTNVAVGDLASVVDSAQRFGKVTSEQLQWERLDEEEFERLIADLVRNMPGWENVSWLTNTRASDRGRDIEAYVVWTHPILGTVKDQTLIQCKHYPKGSVSPKDVEALPNLALTHGEVKVFIIATSGKFTDATLQVIKAWNDKHVFPKFELWDRWRLETELAIFPELITRYKLTE